MHSSRSYGMFLLAGAVAVAGGCVVSSAEESPDFGYPVTSTAGSGGDETDGGGSGSTGNGADGVVPGTGGPTGGVDSDGSSGGDEPGTSGGSTGGVGSAGGSTGGGDGGGTFGSTGGGSGGAVEPPQPSDGMWSPCLSVNDCAVGLGCLTNDSATDGFCSILCTPADDPAGCGPAPGSSPVICTMAGGGESVCALGCAGGEACPTGMACSDTDICM